MKNFIDHEKLDSEGFKNLKKPGEELFIDSMNSNAVKGVQTFLNQSGFKDGKGEELAVDGVVGANTANAVMGYQRAKGLTVDGIVGDETWNSIYKDKKKSESFFGEERKSSRRTTDDNGIPNMPEMDTNKPKSERKDNHFSSNFDVWSGIGNPLKDYGKSEDESFHDKVRRRWGNGGNPSRVLSLSRDNTPGISTSPFRTYKPTGIAFDDYAFSEDESEFSRGNRRTDIPESEYLPEDEIFATEEPELTLMSNSESGKGTNSNSKAEEKEEELGIIKPGYNAKGEWSEDPDADNYGKDSPKYKFLTVFDKAYDIATENDNRNAQIAIKIAVDNLRKYDMESITQAYFLIDNQGAKIFGHAGILLVNEKGEGILFSYFRHSEAEGVRNVQSDTRISVLNAETTDRFIWGATIRTSSSSGDFCTEQYDKGLIYDITPEQGKKILESGINIASNNPKYDLFTNNCSQIAQKMLMAGGVTQLQTVIPKDVYKSNAIFSDGVIENGK